MSDDLYAGGFDGADQIDPSESLTGDNTEDPLDAGYSPPDREPRATRYGDTETSEQRLAEEEPDVGASDEWSESESESEADPRAGRLVAPDEGAHADDESDEIATDVGRAGYAASAEEAAMHIEDDERS
jgi:hypothetical protein